jgi:hypothetical protein
VIEIGEWSCLTLVLLSLGWVIVVGTIAAWPFVRAFRMMRVAENEHGAAAMSFAITNLVWRLALIGLPPLLLVIAWLNNR